MPLPGNAFLALWNDRRGGRDDYDVWHTREHVAERLGVPGMLAVRRYVGSEGPLPPFFTLYSLEDLHVLESPAYRHLIDHPSAWSADMRPDLTDFLRRGCRIAMSSGGGLGGVAAIGFFRALAGPLDTREALEAFAAEEAFTAVHLGLVDEGVAPVSFAGDEPSGLSGRNAVIILEGYEAGRLASAAADVGESLRHNGIAAEIDIELYRLAFALDRAGRDDMLPLGGGAS